MKKLSLSIFTLAAILLTGCNDKDGTINNGAQSGEPVLATFKITSPNTYAMAPPEAGSATENQVDMVEFYIFDETGQRDETTYTYDYSYHKYVGGVDEEIMFMVKSGNNKKFLVVANGNMGAHSGENYATMEALIEAKTLDNTNSYQINGGEFVMTGKETGSIIENRTDNEITIRISRVVSKVERLRENEDGVLVNIPQDDLKTLFTDTTITSDRVEFSLTSYALMNGYSQSYTFTYYNDADNEQSPWDKWVQDKSRYFPTVFDGNGDLVTAYSGEQNGSPWLTTASTFVYENQPSDTISTLTGIAGFPKEEVYAFLVQGTLTDTQSAETFTRYWRVNLIRDDNYRIFRNTIYRVYLDEVRTIGYERPDEGEEDEGGGDIVPRNDQTGLQATIQIVPWRVRTQNTDF